MKRVLLTGANGFIGRHTIPLLLERGFEVHAVSSKTHPVGRKGVHWHQANLLDAQQSEALVAEVQPSHLLHLAWYTKPGAYWHSVENFRWVQASLALLQAFSNCGGNRVVMAGTCAEYDWRYGYCSERVTPLSPSTTYGICKHCLQALLEAFSAESGLSSAWGRIFHLYGPYEHPSRLISSVIRALLNEGPARCSHGIQIRDFLHVEDVASAFIALLDSDVVGPVNIASGQPVALKDVIYKIASKIKRHDLVQLGVIPTPGNDPNVLLADVGRLSEEVGWRPKFDLDTGLVQTIAWWKSGERFYIKEDTK